MICTRVAAPVIVAILLAAGQSSSHAQSEPKNASAKELERLFDLCRLKPEEALWDDLPWMSNVGKALKKASKEGKPLFLTFAGGGGHPLGMC
jgi:hypothetical protein